VKPPESAKPVWLRSIGGTAPSPWVLSVNPPESAFPIVPVPSSPPVSKTKPPESAKPILTTSWVSRTNPPESANPVWLPSEFPNVCTAAKQQASKCANAARLLQERGNRANLLCLFIDMPSESNGNNAAGCLFVGHAAKTNGGRSLACGTSQI